MSDLARFHAAQDGVVEGAIAEVAAGAKRGHWMWFVYPQLRGLGRSATAKRFGIADAAEARAYLADPVLRDRLGRAVDAARRHPDPERVFGPLDAVKLRSSLTLWALVEAHGPWRGALEGLFAAPCPATVDRLR